jgi:hypothetical protein
MELNEINDYIQEMPNEVLSKISFSMPWQYASSAVSRDEDGAPIVPAEAKEDSSFTREALQGEIFKKFHRNPHINTSVRGTVGRMTGFGFETTSGNQEIQEVIEEIELDKRNRLYYFWPKFVGRYLVEGELFQLLTVHTDGFVEVDFVDPSLICQSGDDDTGILYHSSKTILPLFYNVGNGAEYDQIPSIYIARYPSLLTNARANEHYNAPYQKGSKSRKAAYKPFKGYYRFIVGFDKGLFTRRTVSYLRSVLEWLNYYENLKKYEIDYKKAAGAYIWKFSITDAKAFKIWLGMSDEDKRKTGIMAKKTPGGSLILPPGIELEILSPNLTSIKDEDTDILQMVSAGLNESADVLTGTPTGPYSSVKATRGPMTDRISDEIAYFDRYLKHDFWSSIFFIKFKMGEMPEKITVKEAVEFNGSEGTDADPKPTFVDVQKLPEQLVDITYPVSEVSEYESKARAFLGVKHGPIVESLGIPNSDIARKMGFGGYARARLRKATEDDKYPKLKYEAGVDAESEQETSEGEPGSK